MSRTTWLWFGLDGRVKWMLYRFELYLLPVLVLSLSLRVCFLFLCFPFLFSGVYEISNFVGGSIYLCMSMLFEGRGGGGGSGPQGMSDKEESMVVVEEEKKGGVVKEPQPPWIKLGLGIGAYSAATAQSPVYGLGKPASLTPAQLHELQGQALIFKHLEAGVPVPLHLLVPIWKSVASCFGPAIYELYPSFVGYFTPQGFDYKTMMDPEPGRCRRTDGKKWRCSKNVVPDQKYCERHMHRGRQRSRKPVEAVKLSSPLEAMPSNKFKDKLGELDTNRDVSTAVGLPPISLSSSKSGSNHSTSAVANTPISNTGSKKNVCGDTITTGTYLDAAAATMTLSATAAVRTTSTPASTPTLTTDAKKRVDCITGRKEVSGNYVGYNTTMKSTNNRVNNLSVGLSAGLGFSPKSVLQAQVCKNSGFGDGNSIELEPERCRRTDGKKWRCSRDVVPDRKYCVQHMHRGAKKQVLASQAISLPTASTVATHRAPPSLSPTIPCKADLSTPNTDLSISIRASSPRGQDNEKSTSSSSSDTTLTDTSITANEYG